MRLAKKGVPSFGIKYIGEVRSELAKVIWPKRSEVVKLTTTIIIITLIVGVYVGALDFAFTKLLEAFVGDVQT